MFVQRSAHPPDTSKTGAAIRNYERILTDVVFGVGKLRGKFSANALGRCGALLQRGLPQAAGQY